MTAKLAGLATALQVLLLFAGQIECKVYGHVGAEIYDDYGGGGGGYGNHVHAVPVVVPKVVDYYSKPQYAFGYEVEDYYNQLSHGRWEVRDGDVTQGQYRVLLPDGRIQIVSYIADKGGYRPTVTYIGKGHHPPPPPAYANVHAPVVQYHPTAAPPPPPPPPIVHEQVIPLVSTTAAPYHHVPEHGYGHHGPYAHHPPQEIVGGPFKLDLSPHAGAGPIINVGGGHPGHGYGDVLVYGPSSDHHQVVRITSPGKLARKRELMYGRTIRQSSSAEGAAVAAAAKAPRRKKLIKRKIRISSTTTPRTISASSSASVGTTTSTTTTAASPLQRLSLGLP